MGDNPIQVQGSCIVETQDPVDISIYLNREAGCVSNIIQYTTQFNSVKTKIDSYLTQGGVLPPDYLTTTLEDGTVVPPKKVRPTLG